VPSSWAEHKTEACGTALQGHSIDGENKTSLLRSMMDVQCLSHLQRGLLKPAMPGYGTLSQWEYYSEERSGSASSEVLLASFAAAAGGARKRVQSGPVVDGPFLNAVSSPKLLLVPPSE
ncbi:hypothetical protein FOZ63_033970, partial [Perkinsus olseni]